MNVRANLKIVVMASMFSLVMASVTFAGTTRYVDADASAGGDGSTWDTAFKYLQDGLAAVSYGDEIRVAQGVYIPDQNSANPGGSGDREATFQLINGVALKGGYAGAGEPDPNERDVTANETILSGDLAGNDGPDFANNGENSYHVTTGSDTDPNTVLDGLTIAAGNADDYHPDWYGAGMYNESGSPTIINCTFRRNSSAAYGGGVYNKDANMTLTGCMFIGNSAKSKGGGMYNYGADPVLTNCTFIDNSAGSDGGGLCNDLLCTPTITNCIFNGNTAGYYGGAMYNCDSGPMVTNCTFVGNSAAYSGGGVANNTGGEHTTLVNCLLVANSTEINGGGVWYTHCSPILINCTLVDNSAGDYGGGICGIHEAWEGPAIAANCILWDNTADEGPQMALLDFTKMCVSYSCLQGGLLDICVVDDAELIWDANSNIEDDPCFADADANDFHLKSLAGKWDANSESWVTDDVNSPCIDAGDPNSDWSAELWPHGKRINMGAFGGTPQASMSTSAAGNIADLDANDVVNYTDLELFTEGWLRQQLLLSEDLDRDGSVNFKDFAIFAYNWLWEE